MFDIIESYSNKSENQAKTAGWKSILAYQYI